jgi:hypothetical protein
MSDEQSEPHVCTCEGCGEEFTLEEPDLRQPVGNANAAVICPVCYGLHLALSGIGRKPQGSPSMPKANKAAKNK